MSRVIQTDGFGKQRNQAMRTAAELLRRLSQKPAIDAEARDMAAALVFGFKDIENSVEDAMVAWEKRNYWNKVEQFRTHWIWVGLAAARLEQLIREEKWEDLPQYLITLFAHFSEITITKFTRGPDAWEGAYDRLLKGPSPTRAM